MIEVSALLGTFLGASAAIGGTYLNNYFSRVEKTAGGWMLSYLPRER